MIRFHVDPAPGNKLRQPAIRVANWLISTPLGTSVTGGGVVLAEPWLRAKMAPASLPARLGTW